MIANRPDWTLSRQRQWGVPMAFFVHKETGALHPETPRLIEEVAKLIETRGIEAWQTLEPSDLLSAQEATQYEKIATHSMCGLIQAQHTPLFSAAKITLLKAPMATCCLGQLTCISKALINTVVGFIRRC